MIGSRRDWLRARSLDWMTTPCVIVTPGAQVSDGAGGYTAVPPTQTATVCFLDAETAAPREVEEAGRAVAVTVWTCYLPWGTVVTPRDRLLIEGVEYEVADTDGARTDGVTLAVAVRRAA